MLRKDSAAPRETLSLTDGLVIVVGMVVGIGVFATPALVAQFAGSSFNYLALWLAGGALTLVGALCYAEIATAHPHAGGEYHFLSRAYGRGVALMFAWARCTVIQTGAIALVAFVYGDYAQSIVPLGPVGPAIHAGLIIVLFTAINMAGTAQGKLAQKIFTSMDIIALLTLILAAIVVTLSGTAPAPVAPPAGGGGGTGLLGLAMVFVLLTYGGWNEAAYISAELRDGKRNIVRVLVLSIVGVTLLYFLVAWTYLHVLGFDGLQKSSTIAADVMRAAFGPAGATAIAIFVCGAAISTLNATIFTGARIYYALGRDLPGLKLFGIWSAKGENPANAFLLQGAIALALVGLGAFARDGFKTMVEYTSPVFWLFMILVAVSLFIFRHREPGRILAYRVPLYPVTPIIFIATCIYMLYSSLAYTGIGALFGVGVLVAGTPLLLLGRSAKPVQDPAE
ncbi:amino acid permease [Rhizomicrobium sp. SCGC AG-212-E05]|nr:amino acid permease [Rhizomicrobium sp. SCGC AG-212-E05]